MSIREVLFSFKGTITRKQWWIYTISSFIVSFWIILPALFVIGMMLGSPVTKKNTFTLLAEIVVLLLIYTLPLLATWSFFALNIKRLHELGRNKSRMAVLLILSLMLYLSALAIPPAITELIYFLDFYSFAVCFASFLIGVWPLIELGFLNPKS